MHCIVLNSDQILLLKLLYDSWDSKVLFFLLVSYYNINITTNKNMALIQNYKCSDCFNLQNLKITACMHV